MTSGTAAEMAETEADGAVLAALTPVCVARFKEQTVDARQTHIAALQEGDSWQQPDYVEKQGWATMPGAEAANDDLAEACADKLLELSAK